MKEDIQLLIFLYQNKTAYSPYTLMSYMRRFKSDKISATMLSNITGISKYRILKVTGKTAKTGGSLNPDSLEDILALAVRGFNEELCMRILRAGTSQVILSELTGITQSRLSRLWRKHEHLT